MDQPAPSRSRLYLTILAVVAIGLAVVAPWLGGGEDENDVEQQGEEARAEVGVNPSVPCDAEALARVPGLEVGATLADDWRIDAIHCEVDQVCTFIDLAHATDAVTLRACRHVEGGPLPPETRAGSDLFYDSPHAGHAAVPEETVHTLLSAMIARMNEHGSE
jgi:hypothetical protein